MAQLLGTALSVQFTKDLSADQWGQGIHACASRQDITLGYLMCTVPTSCSLWSRSSSSVPAAIPPSSFRSNIYHLKKLITGRAHPVCGFLERAQCAAMQQIKGISSLPLRC